jgi:hypothetical protein
VTETHPLPGPRHPDPTSTPRSTRRGLFPEPERTDDHLAACLRWWDAATLAVWQLIREGARFDAQRITERVGCPYPGDGRRVAVFLTRHAQDGNIRRVAYQPSRRPTSQAIVALWEPTEQGRRTARIVLAGASTEEPS